MKRKRGHKKKKGKSKKQAIESSPVIAAKSPNNEVESVESEEENSMSDDGGCNVEDESKDKLIAVSTPKVVKEKEVEVVPIPPVVNVRPPPTVVYGRVKLKLKNKVVGSAEGGSKSGEKVGDVVDKKGVDDEDGKVGSGGKECGGGKVVSSSGSSGEGGKEGGGGGSGVAAVEVKKSEESEGKVVLQEGGKEVVDSSRKFGGIKFFSSKKSSQGGGKGNGGSSGVLPEGKKGEESEGKLSNKLELEDSSKKSGCIKIVSSKSSSPDGGKESCGSGVTLQDKKIEEGEANKQEIEDGGKKSGGIKIVSSKNSSPEGGKGSSGNGSGVLLQEKRSEVNEVKYNKKEKEDSSKKSGGIKIVSLKNSSSVVGKESDCSGISPQEKRTEESETKYNKQELEDGSKKSGGIKIVSSRKTSMEGGKESASNGLSADEKRTEESEAKYNKLELEDSGKKSGVIKIVSKNLSPSGGKESGGTGLLLEEKKTDEVEAKNNKPELEDCSKKSGGIKIVSSKNPSSFGAKERGSNGLSQEENRIEEDEAKYNKQELEDSSIKIVSINSSPSGGKEGGGSECSPEEKKAVDSEAKTLPRVAKYNKQELEASLEVLKKIMKMDAAEPFNVPVDPIKLGIPDYFDVIDTPMDFGTIRKNLESGTKYMDSEDVYKDVQYVWDNCYKYNNKGDYIVDLMKRVKKNFMKYWIAAGLYNEQSNNIKGEESSPLDEPATSGQGKKLKKGKGFKRHKDDCLCAICIMKRRRREREAREAQAAREAGVQVASPHMKVSKVGLSEEYKQEDIFRTESPVQDTSSYMEASPDGYADVEMEDGEMRPEAISSQYNNEQKSEADRIELHDKSERSGDISERSVQSDKGDAELHSQIEARVQDDSGNRMKIDVQNPPLLLPEGQAAGYLQQRNELLELEKKRQKLRMLETFRDLENPMLLGLCGTLFPNNPKSVWSGGNSLVRCKKSCHRKDIHEAVASFVSPPCKSSSSLK